MRAKQQQTAHDAAGQEVANILAKNRQYDREIKDWRAAKAEYKEQLKAALTVVWEAFESGLSVNGHHSKEAWAKEWAGTTIRNIQHIIYGRKPEANNRSLTLKSGMVVSFPVFIGDDETQHTVKFRVHALPEHDSDFRRTKMNKGMRFADAILEVIEESIEQPAPKKKVKKYSTKVPTGDFMLIPAKPHKTHKMQPDGKRTFCGKHLGDTLAADAKMSDSPTCRNCQTGEERALASGDFLADTAASNYDQFVADRIARKNDAIKRRQDEHPPRRSGKLRKKNPNGTPIFKGTHTLLNETTTHCGIYYSDKPKAQFFGTLQNPPVAENPTCPACKWYLKRGSKTFVTPELSEPAKALAAVMGESRELTWDERVCNPSEDYPEDEEQL